MIPRAFGPVSSAAIAQAVEVTVASLANPAAELALIGTAVPQWAVCKTAAVGTDDATWYRLDATSGATNVPYVVASLTAGLKWVAIAGAYVNQEMAINGGVNLPSETATRVVTTDSNKDLDTPATVTTAQAWSFTSTITVVDGSFRITGSGDSSKGIAFEADGQTANDILTIDTGAQTDSRTATFPVLTGNSILALSNSVLTTSRIPYATTNGILTDSANLTFSGANLAVSGTITASNVGGTNTGDVTLAAVGSSPNANGASLSGQVLTLQPASGSQPGVVSTATQTIAGDKTFNSGTTTVSSVTSSTAQVVVAATAGQVAQFNIRGNNVTNGLIVQHDGSSDATIANFANRPLYLGTNASSNMVISASPGDVSVLTSTDAASSTAGAFKVAGGGVFTKNLLALQGSGRGLTSTATAGATTTLTSASTVIQIFTGATTQLLQMPAASLFGAGIAVEVIVINRSTGTVTAQRAGSDTFDGGGSSDGILTNTFRHYMSNGSNQWHNIS